VRRLGALVVLGASVLLVVALVQGRPQRWLDRVRYPLRYEAIVRGHARNYRLDPALVAAVIYQESKFRPSARSSSGAVGLMQLLPATARGIALRTGGYLLDKYGDERMALAAYNAGQRNVDEWRRDGGRIEFPETRHYVDRVEKLKEIYRRNYDL
jgi:soluble lytic murein transglycosylase